jgi:superfamily I DNA and/or RNA helicase
VDLARLLLIGNKYDRRAHKFDELKVTKALEASFLNEAEIVFTTLNSSGRQVFQKLMHGFDTVLVDEAGQATELETLIPLQLGCTRAVLVGDPNQLPATVLSREAAALNLQRSLFERLQAVGVPALMLTEQYRMHPDVRSFPSSFFYQGRLTDSACVSARATPPFLQAWPFLPYMFFDVSGGREDKASARQGSMRNAAEARFVAALLQQLFAVQGEQRLPSCAVVTPYKEQKACLCDELRRVLGAHRSAAVRVGTVDSFQGQECDVVLFSCVRTSATGIGFVKDVRRMNVALTRAKLAMWVVGNAAALQQHPAWRALLDDAHRRKRLCANASPEALAELVRGVSQPRDHHGRGGGGECWGGGEARREKRRLSPERGRGDGGGGGWAGGNDHVRGDGGGGGWAGGNDHVRGDGGGGGWAGGNDHVRGDGGGGGRHEERGRLQDHRRDDDRSRERSSYDHRRR